MENPKGRSKKDLRSYIRQEVLDLKGYHLKARSYELKLNQNESPYIPPFLWDDLQEAFEGEDLNRYPPMEGLGLREELANNLSWSPEGIVMANGSNVLIQGVLLAASVGQSVMGVRPGFSVFQLEAKICGNRFVEVPLEEDFSFPEEEFCQTMKRENPRVIFIAYPNAPTGNLFSQKALHRVIEEAPGLVVLDEAYYSYSGKTFFHSLEEYPNLLVLRTFSKSSALAGVRLGYLIGQPEIIQEIDKVLPPFRIPRISEKLGILFLKKVQQEKVWIKETLQERERLFSFLKNVQGVTPFPSDANFILIRVQNPHTATKVLENLASQGILVRDFSHYPGTENCLRISVGTPDENNLFMKKFKEVLHG